MPIQVSAIQTWPITFTVTGTPSSGTWNSAIEFWLWTGTPPNPPDQANGAELMVWLGASSGNVPAGLAPIGQAAIGGILWNVYARGFWTSDSSNPFWNYIAYVPANGVTLNSIAADFAPFFTDAESRTGGTQCYTGEPSNDPPCQSGSQSQPPACPTVPTAYACVSRSWWVTSVQAGIELAGGGVGLTAGGFISSVNASQTCNFETSCGTSSNTATISGTAATGIGVDGWSDSSDGVHGLSASGDGVYGTSSSGDGVSGYSPSLNGVYATIGTSSTGAAVQALSNGAGPQNGFGTGGVSIYAASGNTNTAIFANNLATNGGNALLAALPSSNTTGYAIYGTGGGYAVYGTGATYAGFFNGQIYYQSLANSSDIRLKKNIQPLQGALDRLIQLRGVSFEWKDPAEQGHQNGTQQGFIAQEVEKVMPQWIGPNDEHGFKTISVPGRAFEALVVESSRTLKAENDAIRTENKELRNRIKNLEAGRRPLVSGFGESGIGLGMAAIACAIVFSSLRRRRTEVRR